MFRKLSLALLYAAAALVANPVAAGTLTEDERGAIEAMRADTLRRLVFHAAPRDALEAGYQLPNGEAVAIPADGQLRVINFWATWCAPCREEMPALESLRAALAGEAEVMAIATGRNRIEDIEQFNAEVGISMPIMLDPRSDMASSYGVLGLPTTIILDGEGREIARLTGAAHWDEAEGILRAVIQALAD